MKAMSPRSALALLATYLPKKYGSSSQEQLIKKKLEEAIEVLDKLIIESEEAKGKEL